MSEQDIEQAISKLAREGCLTRSEIQDWHNKHLNDLSEERQKNINAVLTEVASFLDYKGAGSTIESGPLCDALQTINESDFETEVRPPDWLYQDLGESDMTRWLDNVASRNIMGCNKNNSSDTPDTPVENDRPDLDHSIGELEKLWRSAPDISH